MIIIVIVIICATAVIIFKTSNIGKSVRFAHLSYLFERKRKNTTNNVAKVNYKTYSFTFWEYLKYLAFASIVLYLIGYLFFRNSFLSFGLCLFSFLYLPVKRKIIILKQRSELELQFKDMLLSVSSSLSAGRSAEGAFSDALNELKLLYPYDNCPIIQELQIIIRNISINEPLEKSLADFAERSGIEDITSFSEVFSICKSTGGNLVEIIRNTASVINQKIDIKNEIEVIIAEKKLSQKIMSMMPFGLLLMISSGSPDYISPLFSPKGNVVMVIVLLLLAISYFLGAKIMDIEV